MRDHCLLPSLALLAACLLPTPASAQEVTGASTPSCDARQAFGIPFGPIPEALRRDAMRVDLHAPPGFVSPQVVYRMRAAHGDARFATLDVVTARDTSEIFQVIARGPAFDPGEETDFDTFVVPRLRPLAAAFARENGLPLSTAGRPPYNVATEDVEIFVDQTFDGRGMRFTFGCIHVPAQRRFERDALRDLFRRIGDPSGTLPSKGRP